MLCEFNIEQSIYRLQNIGSKIAQSQGQLVTLIAQNHKKYVIKYLTDHAGSNMRRRFEHELQQYQYYKQSLWCSDFLILNTDQLLIDGNDFPFQPNQDVLILPFYQTLTKSYLSQLTLVQKIQLLTQIALCLGQIHQSGDIYADLKQSHIALSHDSVKFLDLVFYDQDLFGMGGGSYTPAYMAPELFTGGLPSIQTDIYALGILFFEILQMDKPFQGKSYQDWARLHCQQAIPELEPRCPSLQRIVDGMLAKHKENRFLCIDDVLCLINKLKIEM